MMGLFSYIWRNSRDAQIKILCIVLASFPFYYLSLDLPKYIITDALQGRAFAGGNELARLFHLSLDLPAWLGGKIELAPGLDLSRLPYLLALSGLFLVLVLINGGFKYVINMRKGALGERLLQKLRFDLFSALLRFTPEAMQRLKPSEAATIIKDEVEPIGGFVGDAFVQPAFLGGQALTALVFILIQNLALGAIAAAVVLVQGVVIPRLRREQIRLGKQRQIASRAFAGKIGEIVEAHGEVFNHGADAVERGLVAKRLEALFTIRYRLYGRKFAVKFLNNLLAQFTPFLFYTVGGYFALTGRLDIGQLVAVIAAYRDLPPPIKDLIDWDQQRLDVEGKFLEVVEQFSFEDGAAAADAALRDIGALPGVGAIVAQGLTVISPTGDRLLDNISLTLPLGRHVAIDAGAGEGAGTFAQLVGGRITAFDGSLTIADVPLGRLSADARGRALAYVGPEPVIFDGTLRDNILYGLRQTAGGDVGAAGWSIDHARAGAEGASELDIRLIEALSVVGLADTVFRLGLARRIAGPEPTELVSHIAEIRRDIRARLVAGGAEDAIEPYDPERYTRNATIGENVLFGVPADDAFAGENLASHAFTRQVLDRLELTELLIDMGQRIAATMLEIFRDLAPDHVLFEQFSFIAAHEFPAYRDVLARLEAGAITGADRSQLLGLAFLYVEPRHRLGLLTSDLEQAILTARRSFRTQASHEVAQAISFYDPQLYCATAPLRDNLLFGQVAQGAASALEQAVEAIRATLAERGLDGQIYGWGLEQPAGYAGRLLFPAVKVRVMLARCLIKRPLVLILNNVFGIFGQQEAAQLQARIRAAMAGRTLIVVSRAAADDEGFDLNINFNGAKLAAPDNGSRSTGEPSNARPMMEISIDNAEIAALRRVPIFANLDTARLKLLAFTSERLTFEAGDVLFRQGDESDAAYVLVSGLADVLIATANGPARLTSIAPNEIVGEMGIVTGDVRSATIIATATLSALRLRKDVFLALLAEFPQMSLSVTRLMVKRLQDNVAVVSQHDTSEARHND